jgi:hypothetical protein
MRELGPKMQKGTPKRSAFAQSDSLLAFRYREALVAPTHLMILSFDAQQSPCAAMQKLFN